MGRSDDLIEAARGGNYPLVERILSVKPKKVRFPPPCYHMISPLPSPLPLLCLTPLPQAGPFASLRRQQGGIGSRDASGYTALHYAVLNGHKEVGGAMSDADTLAMILMSPAFS